MPLKCLGFSWLLVVVGPLCGLLRKVVSNFAQKFNQKRELPHRPNRPWNQRMTIKAVAALIAIAVSQPKAAQQSRIGLSRRRRLGDLWLDHHFNHALFPLPKSSSPLSARFQPSNRRALRLLRRRYQGVSGLFLACPSRRRKYSRLPSFLLLQ